MATLMDTYRQLSGPANNPVEKAPFFEALLKTTKFANEEDVLRILNKVIKEGMIFRVATGVLPPDIIDRAQIWAISR